MYFNSNSILANYYIDRLRNEFGHRVQLVPSIHWNRVVISIGNYNIFRCNICNLEIGTNGTDVIASRAIEAVKEALQRIQPKYTYPKVGVEYSILKKLIFFFFF